MPHRSPFGTGFNGTSTKRKAAHTAAQKAARAAAIEAARSVVPMPGFQRTGGFFGRFGPGSPNPELKFHDVDLDDPVVAAAGTVEDSLNHIAQGVTEKTRVGRKCTIRSVNWRFTLGIPESDAIADPASGDTIRLIMFLDKQANGAAPGVTDILASADYQSFNNLANKSRFRTLMDRSYTLNYHSLASDGAAVVSQGNWNENDAFYKKVNIPIEFDATAADGSMATIRSNNIGVLAISKMGLGAIEGKIRLRFSDN